MATKRSRDTKRKPQKGPMEIAKGARIRVVGGPYDGLRGWYEGPQGTTGYPCVRVQLERTQKTISALVMRVQPIEESGER